MRDSLAFPALVAVGLCLSPLAAQARGPSPRPSFPAAGEASAPARFVSDIVAEAERHLGQGNFTGRPGAWCAWAVSAWLRAIGRPPLASGLAASALTYGPRTDAPRPGDLAVIRTRRGAAGHVGIVVADLGADVEIVSGNWSHRVARARIPRRAVTAFVRV